MKEITTSAATAVPVVANQKEGGITKSLQFADATADGTDSSNLPASFEPSGMTEQTATARNGDCQQYGTSAAGARNHSGSRTTCNDTSARMSQISQAPFAGLVQEALQASMATTGRTKRAPQQLLSTVFQQLSSTTDVATTVINPSEPARRSSFDDK